MKTTPLNYDEAVEAFHMTLDETRTLPEQPDWELSKLRGSTWYLRNTHGPMARVNHKAEVRTGRIE